jgi:hypothetical protein
VLGYASLDEAAIDAGIARVAEALAAIRAAEGAAGRRGA